MVPRMSSRTRDLPPSAPTRRGQRRALVASSRCPTLDPCEKTFSSSKTVQHSPEDIFAVVADVDRYREFVPFCARGPGCSGEPSHSRFEAELEIGFRLFNGLYVSGVSLVPGESVTAEAVSTPGGLFERLVSTWRFERGAHPARVRGQVRHRL